MANANRLLVKLRPSLALKAAESRANLRPLHDEPPAGASVLGVGGAPRWFVADLPDGAATPWDLAHTRVAEHLGVAEGDVVFAEPDIVHGVFRDGTEANVGQAFAVGDDCVPNPQDGTHGKALGPDLFAWHLGDEYSQLGKARDAVEFRDPRTRIAHIDTGYYRAHDSVPEHVLTALERNFVSRDADPGSSEDPDNKLLVLDNSGHGTGTL